MTSRERLLTVLRGEKPDCVPACPDISNMVPCRLTGKPYWDIYAFQDPPLWKAHLDAVKYFDIDGGFELYDFGAEDPLTGERSPWTEYIVKRFDDGRFVTQDYREDLGTWADTVRVYTKDNPPATNIRPGQLSFPLVPRNPEPLIGVKDWPVGLELWLLIRESLGNQGILGMQSGMGTCMVCSVEQIYAYHDDPEPFLEEARRIMSSVERRMELLSALEVKPDFLFCGGSGSLVFQNPQIFRDLVLPVLKRTTELAADIGIPTHVHSCGPEKELVKMAAEETQLTIVDPLEIPPMGDCHLWDLKARYGNRIVLKGNIHTTEVMLYGSTETVASACRAAIDQAADGGRFILSTGDQCGRDTPDDNIRTMIEIA